MCSAFRSISSGRVGCRGFLQKYGPSHWICAQAAEGVHALCNPRVTAGEGRVALGISMELAQFVRVEGTSDCNRAV